MSASSAQAETEPESVDTTEVTAAEFEAFDTFPWSKNRAFLLGLVETLGGPDALVPTATHQGSSAFCRTVFYRRQTQRRIDLVRYNVFLASHPAYPSVDRRLLTALYAGSAQTASTAGSGATTDTTTDPASSSSSSAPSRSRRIVDAVAAAPLINPFDGTPTPPLVPDDLFRVPSWQRSAPKNALLVPRSALASGTGDDNNDEAPYSDKFAKVVEAVQTGKPLEGIRQIPNTIIRQEGITPLGKLKAPRKPWERAAVSDSADSLAHLQFPPVSEAVSEAVSEEVLSAEADNEKH